MTADDFDARWRAAANANADPRHCTYPEAVPGYRASRAAAPRTRPAEGPRKHRPDPDALRPAETVEPITRTHHDTGGMIVQWPPLDGRPAEPMPAADAPVTVAEIRQLAAEIDRAVTDTTTALRAAVAEPFDSEAELRKALHRERAHWLESKPARRWWRWWR